MEAKFRSVQMAGQCRLAALGQCQSQTHSNGPFSAFPTSAAPSGGRTWARLLLRFFPALDSGARISHREDVSMCDNNNNFFFFFLKECKLQGTNKRDNSSISSRAGAAALNPAPDPCSGRASSQVCWHQGHFPHISQKNPVTAYFLSLIIFLGVVLLSSFAFLFRPLNILGRLDRF